MRPRRLLIALVVLSVMMAAQYRGRDPNVDPPPEWLPKNPDSEFAFTRMVYYTEARKYGWCCGWTTDYPAADFHLVQGFNRLSRINAHQEPTVMPIDNPRLFEYPLIYSVEPGFLVFSDEEVARLREYLLRGGTYQADDFHGEFEWTHFEHEIKKVLPDRQIVDLPLEHPIFHNVFDIPDKMQVPGEQYVHSGHTWEKGGFTPMYRAILDNDGRPMVVISHNQDWGDAWEHADNPEYEEKYTSRAYRLEINYVVYMMSH
jgi:hypothetical protein